MFVERSQTGSESSSRYVCRNCFCYFLKQREDFAAIGVLIDFLGVGSGVGAPGLQLGRIVKDRCDGGFPEVRGRSDLSFDEGVLMDLYYIENWSLRLYYQILLRTVPAVLFSRGAY